MKTYLITGGAGFIGSNFIHYLFNRYNEDIFIVNLDLLTYAGNLNNLKGISAFNNYRFIKGDICDVQLVDEIFKQYEIDYVVNFAAESHVDRSIESPSVFVRTNVLGVQVLLDAAKKFWMHDEGFLKERKFLQVSTDEVYGSLGEEGYFSETTALDPHSPYSASKAGGDLIVKAYYDTYKMPVIITRCSNNYGPYQFPEKLIPLAICNCLMGKEIPLYGDGKNIRDWVYVEDHCRALDTVLEKGNCGEIYNIGGNQERQNIEVIKTIIRCLQSAIETHDTRKRYITEELITYVKDRKGHDKRYAIDGSKITSELGWLSDVNFEDGMVKTIQWYLDNEDWLKGRL